MFRAQSVKIDARAVIESEKKTDMVLPIILLSYFLLLLDNTIVFTGTVKISQELGLNQASLSWVTNAYALTFGGFLLCGGRLGDLWGRKRVFMVGLIIFGLGSLCVGLAQSAASIIAARAFQGIGSAILAPSTLALLMDNYTGEARTRAIAAYGAAAGIGTSFGLVVGGIFASVFSWRDGFFINVPTAMIIFILSQKCITKRAASATGQLDYIGAVTSILGMSALVYGIIGPAYNVQTLAAAVILLAAFIVHESKVALPMLPLRIFADKARAGAYIARFFYLGGMLGLWFLTPQMLQRVLGFSPLQAGLAFFPFTIVNFAVALQVAKLTRRWGNTKLLIIGLAITAFGMAFLSLFKAESGYWLGVALPMIFLGSGQGLSLSPLTAAGVAGVSAQDAGAASGTVNVVHQIGGSVGLSIIVTLTGGIGGTVKAYNVEMVIACGFFIISLLAAVFLILPETRRKGI